MCDIYDLWMMSLELLKLMEKQNRLEADRMRELHQKEQEQWSREIGIIENVVARLQKLEEKMDKVIER